MSNSSQKQFDLLYVTSPELAKELKVSRAAMCQAVARGLLPNPIRINDGQITLFLRSEVAPFVDAWKIVLNAKRGKNA